MTDVRLSDHELRVAAAQGVARVVSAVAKGRQREPGRTDVFERHCLGAVGEYAAAKALGVFWSLDCGELDTNRGDLAGRIQVKATTRQNGSLIVRPNDPTDMPYLLAIVALELLPVVRVAGWARGSDCKTDENWREIDRARGVHQAAWFVPQDQLLPLELFPSPASAVPVYDDEPAL